MVVENHDTLMQPRGLAFLVCLLGFGMLLEAQVCCAKPGVALGPVWLDAGHLHGPHGQTVLAPVRPQSRVCAGTRQAPAWHPLVRLGSRPSWPENHWSQHLAPCGHDTARPVSHQLLTWHADRLLNRTWFVGVFSIAWLKNSIASSKRPAEKAAFPLTCTTSTLSCLDLSDHP